VRTGGRRIGAVLAAGAALAVAAAAAAAAAPQRVPLSGDVYLTFEVPPAWQMERSSNGVRIDGSHVSVSLAVLEDEVLKTTTEAQIAAAMLRSQPASPPDDAGGVQMAGLNGERFRATLNPGTGGASPVELRVARIDPTHFLVESVAWQPTTPDAEVDLAWKVVVSGILVRPKPVR
jgi:hypothetical protein